MRAPWSLASSGWLPGLTLKPCVHAVHGQGDDAYTIVAAVSIAPAVRVFCGLLLYICRNIVHRVCLSVHGRAHAVRRQSAHFKETRAAIDALVAADFVAAREYASVFEEHRKVHDFVSSWSLEQYTAKKKCASTVSALDHGASRAACYAESRHMMSLLSITYLAFTDAGHLKQSDHARCVLTQDHVACSQQCTDF